jgi:hypothetical protein
MKKKLFLSVTEKASIYNSSNYRWRIERVFRVVEDMDDADIILLTDPFYHQHDFLQRKEKINARLYSFSDEPIWDLYSNVGTPEKLKENVIEWNGHEITQLNHFNSDIFEFDTLPYYLTHHPDIVAKYITMSSQWSYKTDKELVGIWRKRPINIQGLVGKANGRFEKKVSKVYDECNIVRRSKIAQEIGKDKENHLDGKGWSIQSGKTCVSNARDNRSWHYHKMKSCMSSRYLLSMENTLAPNYITEKIFDAVFSLNVPIFNFPPDHKFHKLGLKGINIFGIDDIKTYINDSVKKDNSQIVIDNLMQGNEILKSAGNDMVKESIKRIEKLNKKVNE